MLASCARFGLLLSLPVLVGAGPPAEKLVVVRNGNAFSVAVDRSRGYPAAEAEALAEALGYGFRGTTILMDGEAVQFTEGSPFFNVGREVYQLPNPAYSAGAGLAVPVTWALTWLPRWRESQWRYMDGRLVRRPGETRRPPRRDRWVVVVDAGHGGEDPGTVGVDGTREKDVTLGIARELEKRLSGDAKIQVVMTRRADTLIALGDRPRILQVRGSEERPDLFVSIHANSMPRKPHATRGHEVYFLSAAKTEQARQVALRENASVRFEDGGSSVSPASLQYILSDLQSAGNLRESSLLAASINGSLGTSLRAPDHGVRQGPFAVLVGATVPAVLVEVGYLSNREEERQLRSSAYRAKIAEALADAIVNFLADYGRRVWSSYSSDG